LWIKTSLHVAGSTITLKKIAFMMILWKYFYFFNVFLFELLNKADMQIRVILLKHIKMQIT